MSVRSTAVGRQRQLAVVKSVGHRFGYAASEHLSAPGTDPRLHHWRIVTALADNSLADAEPRWGRVGSEPNCVGVLGSSEAQALPMASISK
jgi:hypothetical protein